MKRIMIAVSVFGFMVNGALAADPAPVKTGAGQVEFRFKFEPGRTCAQRIVSKSVGTMALPLPGPAGDQKFSQVFEQTLVSTCRKVNADKSAVLDASLNDMAMRMSVGGMKVDYDARTFNPATADEQTALLGQIFGAMNGARFTVTVDERGRPLKVEGLAESIKKAVEGISKQEGGQMLKPFFDQFTSLMNDDTMNEQMQPFARMSPPKEGVIKVGEKWDQSWSMKMPFVAGSLEGRGDYELISVEEFKGRTCAKVRVKESFKLLPRAKETAVKEDASFIEKMMGGMQMEISSSGGDGYAYIDCENGELLQLRQRMNLSLSMKVPVEKQDANAEPMPSFVIKLQNSTNVDVIDPATVSTRPARAEKATQLKSDNAANKSDTAGK